MVSRQGASPAGSSGSAGSLRPIARPPWLELPGSESRLLAIVGGYGAGKTEVAVNLALELADAGAAVKLADLDLVNPYFRCREARELLEARGVQVVVPPGGLAFADLPIIVPQVDGMLRPPPGHLSLFDVGGDDAGALALSALAPRIAAVPHEVWLVLNARRPFGDTQEACAAMRAAIESASRLRVTGLVLNTHLGEETTPAVVLEGWQLGRRVAAHLALPVRAISLLEALADAPELQPIDAPRLLLRRRMLPPWLAPGRCSPLHATPPAVPPH